GCRCSSRRGDRGSPLAARVDHPESWCRTSNDSRSPTDSSPRLKPSVRAAPAGATRMRRQRRPNTLRLFPSRRTPGRLPFGIGICAPSPTGTARPEFLERLLGSGPNRRLIVALGDGVKVSLRLFAPNFAQGEDNFAHETGVLSLCQIDQIGDGSGGLKLVQRPNGAAHPARIGAL